MSNKDELYKQCTFRNGDSTTSAWIESKYAKVGLTMKFKDVGDDVRWEVIAVNEQALPKHLIANADTFIKHAHPTNKMRGNK